jgi:hypothetical protein
MRREGAVYLCFVRHNYGTTKMIVTVKKRNVELARREAELRGLRAGHRTVEVMDVVPMRWVQVSDPVSIRRYRVCEGYMVATRRAKSRESKRQTPRVRRELRYA